MPMLRIRAVTGDGQAAGESFEVTLIDPDTGEPLDVTVTLRPISKARARAIHRSHQEQVPDPATRQMTWRYQEGGVERATEQVLAEAIVSWEGIVGADDRPLRVLPETIVELDDRIKMQLARAATGAEVVDSASFRGPADVLPVDADSRASHPVLSARRSG